MFANQWTVFVLFLFYHVSHSAHYAFVKSGAFVPEQPIEPVAHQEEVLGSRNDIDIQRIIGIQVNLHMHAHRDNEINEAIPIQEIIQEEMEQNPMNTSEINKALTLIMDRLEMLMPSEYVDFSNLKLLIGKLQDEIKICHEANNGTTQHVHVLLHSRKEKPDHDHDTGTNITSHTIAQEDEESMESMEEPAIANHSVDQQEHNQTNAGVELAQIVEHMVLESTANKSNATDSVESREDEQQPTTENVHVPSNTNTSSNETETRIAPQINSTNSSSSSSDGDSKESSEELEEKGSVQNATKKEQESQDEQRT